jgi:hypothetical protein
VKTIYIFGNLEMAKVTGTQGVRGSDTSSYCLAPSVS